MANYDLQKITIGDNTYEVSPTWEKVQNKPSSAFFTIAKTSASDTNGRWTATIPDITELYDGLTIRIQLMKSYDSVQWGSGWFNTLKINNLDEKLVWYRYNLRTTSHIPQYAVIELTYLTNAGSYNVPTNFAPLTGTNKGSWTASKAYVVDDYVTYNNATYRCITAHTSTSSFTSANWIQVFTPASTLATNRTGNTTVTDGWVCQTTYDSGNSGDYNSRPYYARYYTSDTPLTRYKMCVLDENRKVIPLSIGDNTSSSKTQTSVAFYPDQIYYYNSSSTTAANSLLGYGSLYSMFANNYPEYTFASTLLAYQDVYLKGTLGADGLFTLDQTNSTSWYVFVPANTNNLNLRTYFTLGNYYIHVGRSYSSNNYMALYEVNTLYYFDGADLIKSTPMSDLALRAKQDEDGNAISTTYYKILTNIGRPTVYAGTLGVNGTVAALPTASLANAGLMYQVVSAGTYTGGLNANVGDLIISTGSKWELLPTGSNINNLHIETLSQSAYNTKVSNNQIDNNTLYFIV